ncbi:MAG: methyltransferase domain-containing protein [Oscillochloris sp.]|nr:methyltransferase domain-containing protein [Oscillochloris sp.]
MRYWRFRYLLGRATTFRLVIGAAGIYEKGWLPTEVEFLDLLCPATWDRYFAPDSVDAMLAEHVWEHLTPEDGLKAAQTCYRYLRTGGYLRIAVPDGLNPDPNYIDAVRIAGSGPGADDHKVLYTYQTFGQLFEKAGFNVHLLEYFDEQGRFHMIDWQPEQGLISRSKRYDPRNADGQVRYTSIVLDAYKH